MNNDDRLTRVKMFFEQENCTDKDVLLFAKLIKESADLTLIKKDIDRANITFEDVLLLAEQINSGST